MRSNRIVAVLALAAVLVCGERGIEPVLAQAQSAAPASPAASAAQAAGPQSAEASAATDGLFGGYAGEWSDVAAQIDQLAEAFPQEKYSWRPAEGIRSTSEVLMHIARANYLLLEWAGQGKMPEALRPQTTEKTITVKVDVISWLKQSQAAVEKAHAAATPDVLAHKIDVQGRHTTVGDMYLRILVHNNEHMGQLTAYARINGVVPPWTK
jgi:uncharacterized damage-inducible protein DinB